MGGTVSLYVTTLKILVTIGILIVKNKNASSKIRILLNLPPLRNLVDWISTSEKTNVTTSKNADFEKKGPKIKSVSFFHFMTTFYNFALKIGTSLGKRVV